MLVINLDVFLKSIFAGIMISIASTVNLVLADSNVIGALLFSIGLCTVFVLNAPLYTGIIGNTLINNSQIRTKIKYLLTILSGNIIGCIFSSLLIYYSETVNFIVERSYYIWESKLEMSFWSILISSFFCGILMYVAWRAYREYKGKSVMATFIVITSVMVFVLCKFDHSIANTFTLFLSRTFTLQSFLYLILMILGNTLGSYLVARLVRLTRK